MEKKEENKNKINENKKIIDEEEIKKGPIIGIIILQDLIETWLKIHILEVYNYDKFGLKRRKTTI